MGAGVDVMRPTVTVTCPACAGTGRIPRVSRALTATPRKVLDFIRSYVGAHSVAPSFEEIAQACGFRSLSSVHDHLLTLERKGYVRRPHDGTARAIELVE